MKPLRRKRSGREHSSEVFEESSATTEATPAQWAMQHFGNQTVFEAFRPGEVGLHSLIAAEIAFDVAGGSGGMERVTSNAIMQRRMRHAQNSPTRSVDSVAHQAGSPLPSGVQRRMEQAFQHNFSHVRIHTDGAAHQAAESINAHAFALGSHIFFGSSEWAPGTPQGDRLLAHELTHVVQSDEGRLPSTGGVSSPSDPAEREAYANEQSILSQLPTIDDNISGSNTTETSPAASSQTQVATQSAPVLRDGEEGAEAAAQCEETATGLDALQQAIDEGNDHLAMEAFRALDQVNLEELKADDRITEDLCTILQPEDILEVLRTLQLDRTRTLELANNYCLADDIILQEVLTLVAITTAAELAAAIPEFANLDAFHSATIFDPIMLSATAEEAEVLLRSDGAIEFLQALYVDQSPLGFLPGLATSSETALRLAEDPNIYTWFAIDLGLLSEKIVSWDAFGDWLRFLWEDYPFDVESMIQFHHEEWTDGLVLTLFPGEFSDPLIIIPGAAITDVVFNTIGPGRSWEAAQILAHYGWMPVESIAMAARQTWLTFDICTELMLNATADDEYVVATDSTTVGTLAALGTPDTLLVHLIADQEKCVEAFKNGPDFQIWASPDDVIVGVAKDAALWAPELVDYTDPKPLFAAAAANEAEWLGNISTQADDKLTGLMDRMAAASLKGSALSDLHKRVVKGIFDLTADLALASKAFEVRFNLDLQGSAAIPAVPATATEPAKAEQPAVDWDIDTLKQLWPVLEGLPPAHVEGNDELLILLRDQGKGIGGAYDDDTHTAEINYDPTKTAGQTQTSAQDLDPTVDSNGDGDATNDRDAVDPLDGVNRFDKVARHEVGHAVDEEMGGANSYCIGNAAGGNWTDYGDDSDTWVDDMVAASNAGIKNSAKKAEIVAKIKEKVKTGETVLTDIQAMPEYQGLDAADKAAVDADPFFTALTTALGTPWYSENTGGVTLGGRIYQRSYKNWCWTSYDPAARARKVSEYQFRAPGEWFAEAYAAYYQPNADGTCDHSFLSGKDPAAKAWFDTNVDPIAGNR